MKKGKGITAYFFKRNKKGDFSLDLIMIVIIIFLISIAWIYIHNSFKDINDDIQADSEMDSEARAQLDNVYENYRKDYDGAVAFIFFGVALMLMVSAWFLDTHPVFFVISMVLFIIVVFVVVIFANTFQEIVEDPSISSTASEWVMTIWIMSHIVELLVGITFLILVILYGKYKS